MLFNNKFILASSSVSRYKMLKKNNLFFARVPPNCKEVFLKNKLKRKKTPIKNISLELSRLKAQSVSVFKKNILVVGSDTVISFRGNLLNKAKNINEAKKKIKLISGHTHFLYSSCSVFYNNKEIWKTTQKSKVKIRKLSDEEIDKYLKKVGQKILKSVGCYQAEEGGPNIIEEIKGDFFNVMGFPLFPFLNFIKEYKIKK